MSVGFGGLWEEACFDDVALHGVLSDERSADGLKLRKRQAIDFSQLGFEGEQLFGRQGEIEARGHGVGGMKI